MSERIEELATQCRIEEYNSVGDLVEFGFDYEKFAELIVKECIEQLMVSMQCDPYTGQTSYADDEVNAIINNNIASIKEHFGVG